MLFLLFFWYRDGQRFLQSAVSVLPFTRAELRFLARRIRQTVRGTVFGRFIVAIIQGISAAIAFWILDVPGASLLGLLTAVCALFPAVGAFFVWFPVVIYLLMIHAWGRAIALLLIGGGFLSTVDNVLFPVIAGAQTRMNTPQMFLSLLGAVWLFGVSGLVLGPVIFTLAESLLVIVARQSRTQRADIRRYTHP
jgi:predicted PurR-regulated permease PerM